MRSLILGLLFSNIGIVLAEIVLAPSNTVVLRGEEMKMTCLTNNNSRVRKWDIFTTRLEPFTIYSANKFHKGFNHFDADVNDNGSGILYTNSTKLSDAGIYKCLSIIDNVDKEHSAQLTVLDSIPTCEENFTLNSLNSSKSLLNGEYIWMECSVSFRGFWTPSIEWIEYGGHLGPEGRVLTEGVEVTRIANRSVTSNLTIAVNSSRDGSHFTYKIYFAKYDGTHNMTASNVPNFTYIWNSSVITLSLSTPESVSTTIPESVESSTDIRTTREDRDKQYSTDWYFISLSLVVALSVFLIIIVVLVVAFCIRFRKKLSAKYASAAAVGKSEMPIRDGDYDILPYATSDNYDTIDETVIDVDLTVFFAPRQGPLPTPGYSGLTQMESTAPGVYSRIDTYETLEDIAPGSRDMKVLAALETNLEKQVDDSKEKKKGGERNETPLQPYLELFDADNPETISEKHVHDSKKKVNGKGEMESKLEENQSPVHPYIELVDVVVSDNSDECKRTSDCDIPSSYITVNF